MINDGVLHRQPSGTAVSKNKDGLVRWLSGLADADEVGLTLCGGLASMTDCEWLSCSTQ